MKFKGYDVVQRKREFAGSEADFWVPEWEDIICTVHDSNEPGFEERYWQKLYHEGGHIASKDTENPQTLRVLNSISEKDKKLIHEPSLRELLANLYAYQVWLRGTSKEQDYLKFVRRQIYSYDHNLARRLFFNFLETGHVFDLPADINVLKGEYVVVGAFDSGKSSLVNYLFGEEVAHVEYMNPIPGTEEVQPYERGKLKLWDTPPLYIGNLSWGTSKEDNKLIKRLEEITLEFLRENSTAKIIYLIRFPSYIDAQLKHLKKIYHPERIGSIVLSKADDPVCLDGKFIKEYRKQLPSGPIAISVRTGEGIYKLIKKLMG